MSYKEGPMREREYLMESDDEALRLDIKTDSKVVRKQAFWAGIKPGMRVIDICCGPGKTTSILQKLVNPNGSVQGVDYSKSRIQYARKHYSGKGIRFREKDILKPLKDLGMFDFAWVRFVLEYYQKESREIVRNVSSILKPGGVLCLIDLDHNCMNHYGIPEKLEHELILLMKKLGEKGNFDPYAGRKLYSYIYDLGFQNIDVLIGAHHCIFGELKDTDAVNWRRKVEIIPERLKYRFREYKGGYREFLDDFYKFFYDPGRFTYTPVICARGQKPRTAG